MTADQLPDSAESDVDGWQPELPGLPRPAAVENLELALAKRLSPAAAHAIARAAARPDELRRKLSEPSELRVQGGTLLVVESALWTTAVNPHPANPREYGGRLYSLGGLSSAGVFQSFEPDSAPDGRAELGLHVHSADELEDRVADAKTRLVRTNPLAEDIAAEGVLQPVTVVALKVQHDDDTAPTTLLIAADGSSRASSAWRILFGPVEEHPSIYELAQDDRAFRRRVNALLKLGQRREWSELTERERGQLRALTLPSRVVVGFRPDGQMGLEFHTAVRNLIGLTHIRPPKPYGAAVENEAKADAVLDNLATAQPKGRRWINDVERSWYAGTTTPDQASSDGLSLHADVRAAEIVRTLLGGGMSTARRVNQGIRALTAKVQPKREDRVDIAVELILRPLRTPDPESVNYLRRRRAVLQRAYRLAEISSIDAAGLLEPSKGSNSLERLRDRALDEVRAGHGADGRLAQAQTELAVKAAYCMAISEPMALEREIFGGTGDDDDRSPSAVLRAMMSRERGVLQAYHAVKSGRLDEPILETDEIGKPVVVNGQTQALTDDALRNIYSGTPRRTADAGELALAQQWQEIDASIEELRRTVIEMEEIPDLDGTPRMIANTGWDVEMIRAARSRVDRIDRRLAAWGDTCSDLLHQAEELEQEERSEA